MNKLITITKPKKIQKLSRVNELLLLGTVFVFSFASLVSLFVAIQKPGIPLSPFDAYYHAQVSYDIAQGNEPKKPILHPNRETSSTTLYWGYHNYLSIFMPTYANAPVHDLIWRLKVAHSMLFGLFVTSIFLTIFKLLSLRSVRQKMTIACSGAIISIMAGAGIYRFLTERPHVIAVMLSIWVLFAVLTNKKFLILIVGILSSLTYAFVLLIGIPAYIALLTTFFYGPDQKAIFQKKRLAQVMVLIFGFGIGTIIRPDSWYHLYNGTFLHLQELTNHALGQAAMQIQELSPGMFTMVDLKANLIWFIILVFGLGAGFLIHKETNSEQERDMASVFIALNTFFMLMSLVFTRTTEYWYPIGIITGAVLLSRAFTLISKTSDDRSKNFFKQIPKKLQRSLLISIGASVVVFGSLYVLLPISKLSGTWLDSELYTATSTLDYYSDSDDVITNSSFSLFPHLYITNPDLDYQFGFSDIFSETENSKKHWIMVHITGGSPIICAAPQCTEENTITMEEALDRLDTDFLFIDLWQSGLAIMNYRNLEAASNANLIYKSKINGPRIMIYKIERSLP